MAESSDIAKITQLFRRKMQERGVLAVEVAEATGLSPSAVTRLLRGETKQPRTGTLERIGKFLDLDWTMVAQMTEDEVPEDQQVRKELEQIYRKLSDSGKLYLVATAQGMLAHEREGGGQR